MFERSIDTIKLMNDRNCFCNARYCLNNKVFVKTYCAFIASATTVAWPVETNLVPSEELLCWVKYSNYIINS